MGRCVPVRGPPARQGGRCPCGLSQSVRANVARRAKCFSRGCQSPDLGITNGQSPGWGDTWFTEHDGSLPRDAPSGAQFIVGALIPGVATPG